MLQLIVASFSAFCLAGCGPDFHLPPWWDGLATVQAGATAEVAYSMHSAANRALCITIPTGRATAGTQLILSPCQATPSQRWARYGGQLRGDGGMCMQAKGGADAEGTAVVVAPCDSADALPAALTASQIQFGGRCVAPEAGRTMDGAALVLRACAEGGSAHAFVVAPWSGQTQAEPTAIAKAPAAKPAPKTASPTPVAAAATNTFGPSPAGTMVAPYFYGWGSSTGFAKTLVEARERTGLKAATIAFGLSGDGYCGVTGFEGVKDDMAAFKKAGGVVILGFGGAAGTYLQTTCTDVQKLADAIDGQMALHNTRLIDFDIEGHNLDDAAASQRLIDALKKVQAKTPKAVISFTLPVDPESGLPPKALAVLQMAAKSGLRVGRVNVMAMTYYRKPPAPKTAGDFAAMAGEATARQMRQVWPDASWAETYHAIGITPMLGQQDGDRDAPFLVDDAVKVAGYAHEKGIGLLSFWALQRDLAAKGDYNHHSNHQDADYAYLKAFSTRFGSPDTNVSRGTLPAAPAAKRLDLTTWTQEVHASRAFNNEEQRYQGGGANAAFLADGTLIITAAKDAQGWSSARLHGDQVGPLPAYYEATITVPTGRGVWPAFWLTSTGPWPQGGEIDAMEQVNGENIHHVSAHWGHETGVNWFKPTEAIHGVDPSKPHRYGAFIAADGVQYYLDGKAIGAKFVFPAQSNFPDIASKMVPIVNLAMGGNWPGPVPNETGVQQMVVHQVIKGTRAP